MLIAEEIYFYVYVFAASLQNQIHNCLTDFLTDNSDSCLTITFLCLRLTQ